MAKRNIEAQKLVECSAEQGNIDARLLLGVAYETDMLGLEKNARKMFYWYQRAAMQNDPKDVVTKLKISFTLTHHGEAVLASPET